MNTQSVISINPTGTPTGIKISKDFLGSKSFSKKPISEMRQTVRLLLGISTSASDSRRQWTFRLVFGSILMCFGLLFLSSTATSGTVSVVHGVSAAMIAGGAFIATGLFSRLVSFALGIILLMFTCHINVVSMTGYAMIVCLAVCVAAIITGSGRYSLDTLIYNGIFRNKEFHAF